MSLFLLHEVIFSTMSPSRERLAVAACALVATVGRDQAGKHPARASLPPSKA